ncbi:MAG: NADH-quinone oxidoreductase subunit C [Thaumarchaeota archaeon]|nr:NADH-quinone oxidoreductase subunit C [Nitrososphaerota archaeon]
MSNTQNKSNLNGDVHIHKNTDSNSIDKKEDDRPEFETNLANTLLHNFGEKIKIDFIKKNRIKVNVQKENIVEIAKFISLNMKFDHAEAVTGIDYPEQNEIEVVYHLGSYEDNLSNQILALSTSAIREDDPTPGSDRTKLPSLRNVFYSVEFHERECFEMLGVYFENHPDNRRLLLPEDWADIPPLRKDFKIKGR